MFIIYFLLFLLVGSQSYDNCRYSYGMKASSMNGTWQGVLSHNNNFYFTNDTTYCYPSYSFKISPYIDEDLGIVMFKNKSCDEGCKYKLSLQNKNKLCIYEVSWNGRPMRNVTGHLSVFGNASCNTIFDVNRLIFYVE